MVDPIVDDSMVDDGLVVLSVVSPFHVSVNAADDVTHLFQRLRKKYGSFLPVAAFRVPVDEFKQVYGFSGLPSLITIRLAAERFGSAVLDKGVQGKLGLVLDEHSRGLFNAWSSEVGLRGRF